MRWSDYLKSQTNFNAETLVHNLCSSLTGKPLFGRPVFVEQAPRKQEEAKIKRSARLAPLESQTAKALALRRRCDPPGCEEVVFGAARGQDGITALGGVLEVRVFRKLSLCVVKRAFTNL